MKHYTSIEQSKKLLELGLSPKSADMCYKTVDVDNAESDEDCVFDLVCKPYTEYLKYVIPLGLNYKAIPCWSLGALLEVMPAVMMVDDDFFYQIQDRGIGGSYSYIYKNPLKKPWENGCWLHGTVDDSPTEAVYNMVVWLLENGYIKKEKTTLKL